VGSDGLSRPRELDPKRYQVRIRVKIDLLRFMKSEALKEDFFHRTPGRFSVVGDANVAAWLENKLERERIQCTKP